MEGYGFDLVPPVLRRVMAMLGLALLAGFVLSGPVALTIGWIYFPGAASMIAFVYAAAVSICLIAVIVALLGI